MRRTTMMLDDDLYRQIKRTALDYNRPMRALMTEALRMYLGRLRRPRKAPLPKFGLYEARIVSSLRREEFYRERVDRSAR